MGTKVGYMSSIRHYIRFAMNNGVDPAILPASPLFLQFWISDRAGAAVNVSSLTTWTAAIGWWHELGHAPKTYQDDRDYRLFIRNITKQYKKAPKKRLPIRIHHLIGLVKALKVVPGNYDKCDFDDLVTVTVSVIAFFTASRPSEIVKSTDGYNESGLLWKNCGLRRDPRTKKKMHFLLTVMKYKNQQFRAEPKVIPLATARKTCRHQECVCKWLDPVRLLAQYMTRRSKLAEKNSKLKTLQKKAENPLFVFKNGRQVTTAHLGRFAKKIAEVNAVLEPKRFTGYSFRVGGTTLASIQGIEKALILQYVKWAENKLPDASHHYTVNSEEELSLMARRMIHNKLKLTINESDQRVTKVYDPWATSRTLKPSKQGRRSRK